MRRTEMGSSCNGSPSGTSRPTCPLATTSVEKTVRFTDLSGLPICPRVTAIAVLQASNSTMAVAVFGRTHVYIGTRKRCGTCSLKAECTSSPFRYLAVHWEEPARQRARALVNTPEFAKAHC